MKNATIKENGNKLFNELTENELYNLLEVCTKSARSKMLRYYSNVKMIDNILFEEYNDIISQAYIYSVKLSEKLTETKAFSIVYASVMRAYFKLISERLGKRILRKNENGNRKCIGLFEELETEQIMKTKTERTKNDTDIIELRIDIENMLTLDELKIVYYLENGYKQKEIAIIQKITTSAVSQKIQKIRKKLSKM